MRMRFSVHTGGRQWRRFSCASACSGGAGAPMIPLPSGVRVWLATGHTDMRKGLASLSLLVQEVLRRDPLCGHLFCFRGRRDDLLKVIWHDGQGACLFHEAIGAWPVFVADRARRLGDYLIGAAGM